jgi:nucleoside-diphosphate-sugar epimerase
MVNLNNNMNILITGGAGFIGSNLCNYLLEKIVNVSIFIVDNLSTGKINNLKNDKRIKFIKGDVTNLKFLEILFKNINSTIFFILLQ